MIQDIHSHTYYSFCGSDKPEEAVEAAIAGGVTTVFDMPNTVPPTVNAEGLKMKLEIASEKSKANTGFHIGASNSNVSEICRLIENGDADTGISASDIQGVKVFMGSSTGNMLVDDKEALAELFRIRSKPVLVHCEDESIIKANLSDATEKYGEDIPFTEHRNIRSRRACIVSSIKALELAKLIKYI